MRKRTARQRVLSLPNGNVNAPDGKPAQADSHIMGVASQTPAAVTGRFVVELKADGEDEGEDQLNKRFGVVQQCKGGRLIVEVDGEGAVLACRFGSIAHVSSPSHQAS